MYNVEATILLKVMHGFYIKIEEEEEGGDAGRRKTRKVHVIVLLAPGLPPCLHRLHLPLSLPLHLVPTNRLQAHNLYVTRLVGIEYTCVAFLYSLPLMTEQYPRYRTWREWYRWRSRG